MEERELLELLVEKENLKFIGSKFLHVVDETFYSIPTNGVNCCSLNCLILRASIERRGPGKEMGSDGGVPVASPMIKSVKGWRRWIRKFVPLELHTFLSWEGYCLILELVLDFRKDNLMIFVIKSIFPY